MHVGNMPSKSLATAESFLEEVHVIEPLTSEHVALVW